MPGLQWEQLSSVQSVVHVDGLSGPPALNTSHMQVDKMGDNSGSDDETGSSSAIDADSDAEDGQGAAAGLQDARAASTRAKAAALAVLEGEAP